MSISFGPMTGVREEMETGTGRGSKPGYVRSMFAAIAPRYDLLNHLLSLNTDRRWRRRAIDRLEWSRAPGGNYLDLCAGTLDLGVELERREGFRGRLVGADFVVEMLRLGRRKTFRVRPVGADALGLPFPPQSFDGVTMGFGLRNLADLAGGLAEVLRVLKPGGKAVILEFCLPRAWPERLIYLAYFKKVLPLIGRLVSRHGDAYTYLPQSVLRFPEPEDLEVRMAEQGFRGVGFERMTLGIVAIHWGFKQGLRDSARPGEGRDG